MSILSLLLLGLVVSDLPRAMSEEGLVKLGGQIDSFEARIEADTRVGTLRGAAVFVRIGDRAELLTTTSMVAPGNLVELLRPDGRRVTCTPGRIDPNLGLVALEARHGLLPVTGPGESGGPVFSRWRDGARPVSWADELGPGADAEAFFQLLPYSPPRGQAVVDRTGKLRGLSFGPSGYASSQGLYVPWAAIHEFILGRKPPAALGQRHFSPADFRP